MILKKTSRRDFRMIMLYEFKSNIVQLAKATRNIVNAFGLSFLLSP